MLSATQVLQYELSHYAVKDTYDKRLTRLFVVILGLRAFLLLIGSLLPVMFGIPVAILGILISWMMPGFFRATMVFHPINFPHLIERLTSLIIIMFGEMIVGISNYFTVTTLNIQSLFVFLTVCSLFMTYITQFDHYLDTERTSETGVSLIYLHYFILFGLMIITSSLSYAHASEITSFNLINSLHVGLLLFYFGLFLASPFNKINLKLPTFMIMLFVITACLSWIISILFNDTINVTATTAIVTLINSVSFSAYMVRHNE